MGLLRRCSGKCKSRKPLTEFYFRNYTCKECCREKARERQIKEHKMLSINPLHKNKLYEFARKWNLAHPVVHSTSEAVINYAIYTGRIRV
jgi:hypothetical protein